MTNQHLYLVCHLSEISLCMQKLLLIRFWKWFRPLKYNLPIACHAHCLISGAVQRIQALRKSATKRLMLKSWTDLYFALERDYWKAARIATKKSAQLTVNETAAIWTISKLQVTSQAEVCSSVRERVVFSATTSHGF